MRGPRRALLPVALAALLGGCGGDEERGEPIPGDVAAAIESQLDNIRGQIEDGSLGACEDIKEPRNTFAALQNAARRVPQDVDPDVRDALTASINRLSELVDEQCASIEDTEPEPEPTETLEVPPVTEEEEPPPETVPEETVPEETLPPGLEKKLEEPGSLPPEEGPGNPGGGGGAPVPGEDG